MSPDRTTYVVSDACQINDFDHYPPMRVAQPVVSDACQINDFDHFGDDGGYVLDVSDACQINDFDHSGTLLRIISLSFRCLSDQ